MPKIPEVRPVMIDDRAAITRDWLQEVCYAENGPSTYGFESEDVWFEIEINDDNSMTFYLAGSELHNARIRTRGDVRAVCWMMGCDWFHQCWGKP